MSRRGLMDSHRMRLEAYLDRGEAGGWLLRHALIALHVIQLTWSLVHLVVAGCARLPVLTRTPQ